MKNHFLRNTLLTLVALFCFSSYSNSQEVQTTPNLIQPYGWQGCLTQHPGWIWAGNSGGPCPVQRAGDGAILFSYGQYTLHQSIAINQALSGTGIQIRGYDYSWTIKNANAGSGQQPSFDPLSINVSLYDAANANILESKTYDYSYRINDWTTFRGTEEYANRYSLSSVGNINVSISGRDAGYWAGYYGAEINHISLRLRYSVDICAANPLASPDCPGYAEAYKQQQCIANPLFDVSCPGYEQANFSLQCSMSPLYNPGCPGYQQAFFNQQCSVSALYNPECPGYKEAFFTQQCTLSALYDSKCPGYKEAYLSQQCSLNALYDKSCPDYSKAFFNQQCTLSALYDENCPGYQQAFFSQQCLQNTLYDSKCPGYQQAYLLQQCSLNSLYNPECPGYQVAYQEKLKADACKANPQSSSQCPGYKPAEVQVAAIPVQTPTPADPVSEVKDTPLVSDPIVNSTLSLPKEQPKSEPPQLGTGLRVPGVTTRQTSRRETAKQAALQTTTRAENVTRDAQQVQQDTAIATMAEVPGFNNYQSAIIPDAQFYQPKDLYRGNVIRDNARAQRSLTQRSDRLHTEMINEQYRK